MTKAQQTLKEDIEKIKDDATIEKVRIYLYKHTRKVIPILPFRNCVALE